MVYAVVDDNGVVVNLVESESALAPEWVPGTGAKIGDNWDGEKFTTPPSQ